LLLLAACHPRAAAPAVASECVPHDLMVADLHVDLPYQVHYRGRPVSLDQPGSAITTASLRRGRVRFLVLSLYLWSGFRAPRHTMADVHALLGTAERIIRDNPEVFAGHEPIRYLFSMEGAHPLAGREDELAALMARGVRIFGLTHWLHNQLGDSSTDPRRPHGGLTPAGRALVGAIYERGGLIDVSHASDATFADIAAIAREHGKPLIATHSNARAVTPHPRNLTDDQLRAVAASGGLVGLSFHAKHLRAQDLGQPADATIADLVDHASHMIAIMGAEHLAIGSDLDGNIAAARGLEDHGGMDALLCALRRAGMSADTVRAIAAGNAVRVLGPYAVDGSAGKTGNAEHRQHVRSP
jgi:membrane dipeptidase